MTPHTQKLISFILLSTFICSVSTSYAAPIFQEDFEDTNFESRGWFDSTDAILSTSEHIIGSTASAQFTYNSGDTSPTNGRTMRMSFAATDEIYISYYVKYSTNWQGSDQPFHPHEFYLLTTLDSEWSGLSGTHMTAYIEQNEGIPLIAIQDSQNINMDHLNENLISITENRAAAGCNGLAGAAVNLVEDCYAYGSGYRNVLEWRADQVYFSDQVGSRYKNDWHRVEAYLKMNSITNGVGNYDGTIEYIFDGQTLISHNNVLFRTGQNPNMRFDTFIIAPYIGTGSPVTQTMWVDNLVVATSNPSVVRPLPPTELTVE